MPAYLDDEWVEAWAASVRAAGDDLRRAARGDRLRVTTHVEDPDGPGVTYHLEVGPEAVLAGAGPAEPTDLSFRQSRAVAVAVARGDLNAQEAFLHGALVVGGDVRLLVAHTDLFRTLDEALADLRAATTY